MNLNQIFRAIVDDKSGVQILQRYGIVQMELYCDDGHEMAFCYGEEVQWRCYMRECKEEKLLYGIKVADRDSCPLHLLLGLLDDAYRIW
jgi:hypothetical protein